jgi:predicted chitinase
MDAELHKAGITDPREIAAFKAQIDAETSGFNLLKEKEYSPDAVWRLRGKQLESMGVTKDQIKADYDANGSKAMFEYMYSDKYRKDGYKLGNTEAGDGENR